MRELTGYAAFALYVAGFILGYGYAVHPLTRPIIRTNAAASDIGLGALVVSAVIVTITLVVLFA